MDAINATIELAYALDTFYFLVSGALVMWMAAGFTMLEAGMVRTQSTVEILTKNVGLYSIACIMYLLIGYNLMYSEGITSLIPGFGGVLTGADNATGDVLASGGEIYYSNVSDFFFQVVFVATAMSIISGAVAERMRLSAFLLFAVILTGLIYPVQGYWSWGGGLLDQIGYLDYAGSGIVHYTGAVAALAGVILLGARRGKYGPDGSIHALPGANLPLATLGTFILWLGWFGFNGGSELKVSDVESANAVAQVFANTNLAAAGGAVAALMASKLLFRRADLTMILNGALAGLVSITAEPLMPEPLLATLIGMVGGVLVVFAILGFDRIRIDDPVGAISVHGVAGIWGVMAVLLSNPEASFLGQLLGLLVIGAFVFIASLAVWALLRVTIGIRLSDEEEEAGADVTECGLEAYPQFTGGGGSIIR